MGLHDSGLFVYSVPIFFKKKGMGYKKVYFNQFNNKPAMSVLADTQTENTILI
jgi:hypothetical protein